MIAGQLYKYWYMRSHREGRQWLERLLERSHDLTPDVEATALLTLASILVPQGEEKATGTACQRGLPLGRRANKRNLEGLIQVVGPAERGRSDFKSPKAKFRDALAAFEATGNKVLITDGSVLGRCRFAGVPVVGSFDRGGPGPLSLPSRGSIA